MTQYAFATDSESGHIEATSFAAACEKLDHMVSEQAIADGGWGWVEDVDGERYEIGER